MGYRKSDVETHSDRGPSLPAVNVKSRSMFASVPCERSGNIHCTMLPDGFDPRTTTCAPCKARAAIAKATG